MKNVNKNLLIIFGTTRGIGKELHKYTLTLSENSFILVNRKSVTISKKHKYQKLTLDLSKPFSKNIIFKLHKTFSQQHGYKNIYLILNASVVEPIKRVGFTNDELLLKSTYVNFLNYERIINAFISSTRHLHSKKKILVVSSKSAVSPSMGLASYCSTKAALEMFVKCLFLEQKKNCEYSVIALRPGVVDTNMQKKIRSSKKENFPKVSIHKKMHKQKKLLKPEDVARKIYSLINTNKYWSNPVINIKDIK